jgi:hypothetical protein
MALEAVTVTRSGLISGVRVLQLRRANAGEIRAARDEPTPFTMAGTIPVYLRALVRLVWPRPDHAPTRSRKDW